MTSQSKTPGTPAKPKDSAQISADDDNLAEGELSQEDLEKIAGGRAAQGRIKQNRHR